MRDAQHNYIGMTMKCEYAADMQEKRTYRRAAEWEDLLEYDRKLRTQNEQRSCTARVPVVITTVSHITERIVQRPGRRA